MKRRLLGLLLAVTMIAGVFTGCGNAVSMDGDVEQPAKLQMRAKLRQETKQ